MRRSEVSAKRLAQRIQGSVARGTWVTALKWICVDRADPARRYIDDKAGSAVASSDATGQSTIWWEAKAMRELPGGRIELPTKGL